jgi:uncharacterized phage protein (TIGR01671 family)
MRDIKFRCFVSSAKIMVDFDEMKKHGDFYKLLEMPSQYPIMQFTGLTDKNGVEIYEGDLIEVVGNKKGALVVEFINDYVGGWVLTHYSTVNHLSLGCRKADKIEIVGNKYENYVLIKDKL